MERWRRLWPGGRVAQPLGPRAPCANAARPHAPRGRALAGTLLMTAIFGVRMYLKHKDNDSFNINM